MRSCRCPLDLPQPRPGGSVGTAAPARWSPQTPAQRHTRTVQARRAPLRAWTHDPDGSMTRAPTLSGACARVSSRRPVVALGRMPLGWLDVPRQEA